MVDFIIDVLFITGTYTYVTRKEYKLFLLTVISLFLYYIKHRLILNQYDVSILHKAGPWPFKQLTNIHEQI